jgi:hypothetical protein
MCKDDIKVMKSEPNEPFKEVIDEEERQKIINELTLAMVLIDNDVVDKFEF